jgi:hypothetical protein
MKKIVLIFLAFFLIPCLLSAQEDSSKLPTGINEKGFKIFKTWISLKNEPNILEGALYEIKDSSILVSNSILKDDYINGEFELSKIDFNNIDLVKIRRKNSMLFGALIGAATGFGAGGLIGLISGDDPPGFFSFSAGEKALLLGFSLAVGGAGIGTLDASLKIKIPINGSIQTFNKNKERLKKYSYIH